MTAQQPDPATWPGATSVGNHGLPGIRGVFADIVAAVEEWHHRIGWDNSPATLYRVLRDDDSFDVAGCRLIATGLPPAVELAMLADALSDAAMHSLPGFTAQFNRLYNRPLIGHAVAFEGWARPADSLDDPREAIDIPGSREVRMCIGVMGRAQYIVTRPRGRAPVLACARIDGGLDGGLLVGTDLTDALVRLHRGTAAFCESSQQRHGMT